MAALVLGLRDVLSNENPFSAAWPRMNSRGALALQEVVLANFQDTPKTPACSGKHILSHFENPYLMVNHATNPVNDHTDTPNSINFDTCATTCNAPLGSSGSLGCTGAVQR